MKERTDFEEYNSGFFYTRFNRLLKLIRKNRVLPIRPGWEQTPDGIVPPPIYNAQALAARPFQVTKTGDDTVQVETGAVWTNTGGGEWVSPAWDTGGFSTDHTINADSVLYLILEYPANYQLRGAVTVRIGWDITPSGSTSPYRKYFVDFAGESVSATQFDSFYQVELARALFTDDEITEIIQRVDYNVISPPNGDHFVSVEIDEV
jgi:hypothetical protein